MESSVADRDDVLSKRGGDILFFGLLTLLVAGVVSLVLCIAWFGLDGRTASRWARGMTIGWIAAFPTVLLLLGLLRRFSSRFVR